MALTFTEDSPSQLTISNSGGKDIVLTNDPSNPTTIPQFAPGSKVSIQGTLYGQVPASSYGGIGVAAPVTYTMARSPSSGAVNEGSAVSFTVTASDGSASPYPYTITGITSADLNPSGTSLTGTGTTGTAVPFTLASDNTTEGTETMTFTIPGSYTGPQQSLSIPISDTSTTPGGGGGGGGSGPFLVLGPLSAPYITYPNSTAGINNVWYRRGIVRYNLIASELSTAGMSGPTALTSISWSNINVPTRPTQPNFTILLAPTLNPSSNSAAALPQTTVRTASPYTWTSVGPTTFPFTTPWTYPGSNGIQVTVIWGQVSPNYASSGQMKFRAPGRTYYARSDGSGIYPSTQSTPQVLNTGRPITEFNK